jgi:hypothetical protein
MGHVCHAPLCWLLKVGLKCSHGPIRSLTTKNSTTWINRRVHLHSLVLSIQSPASSHTAIFYRIMQNPMLCCHVTMSWRTPFRLVPGYDSTQRYTSHVCDSRMRHNTDGVPCYSVLNRGATRVSWHRELPSYSDHWFHTSMSAIYTVAFLYSVLQSVLSTTTKIVGTASTLEDSTVGLHKKQ